MEARAWGRKFEPREHPTYIGGFESKDKILGPSKSHGLSQRGNTEVFSRRTNRGRMTALRSHLTVAEGSRCRSCTNRRRLGPDSS